MAEATKKRFQDILKKQQSAAATAQTAPVATTAAAASTKPAEKPVDKTKEAKKPAVVAKKALKLADIKHLPKLNKEQTETLSTLTKSGKAKDDLAAVLSAKVTTDDQLFDMAKKYGVSDVDIKKYKKTPNPGTMRMSLGIRIRHLIMVGLSSK